MEMQNREKTVFIIIGVMVGILLASLDSYVVSTAMPKIIGSLRGTNLYTWPVTIYMLAMTISTPLFGKLSDVYGYKPIYLFGICLFIIGSIFCGVSQNMLQFIIFRGLQGIGGAILISNSMVIIGILFPPADRAKYGSFVTGASGIASLIGPIFGGLITDGLSWRWIFFVNIPVGIIALIIVIFTFPAYEASKEKKGIDYVGAVVLIIALTPLLLAFTWGGGQYAWNSIEIIGMLIFTFLMLIVFGITEFRAADPIIPLKLFKNSIFNCSALEMFLFNGVMVAVMTFIPMFLQVVKGVSASSSGAVTTPMTFSLMVGVAISGLLISKSGRYKLLSIIGFFIMESAAVLLLAIKTSTANSFIALSMIIMGLGIGTAMAVYNVTAQNVFPKSQMGVVTSAIQFFRMLGQAIASSLFGTILSSSLSNGIHKLNVSKFPIAIAKRLKDPNIITDSAAVKSLKSGMSRGTAVEFNEIMVQIKQIFLNAIHHCFIICAIIVMISLVIAFFMKEIPMYKEYSKENIVE